MLMKMSAALWYAISFLLSDWDNQPYNLDGSTAKITQGIFRQVNYISHLVGSKVNSIWTLSASVWKKSWNIENCVSNKTN